MTTSTPNDTTTRETADSIRAKIVVVAASASVEERASVNALIARAINADKSGGYVVLTPPMSAIIFDGHNAYSTNLAKRNQSKGADLY